jgi:hypothetical protein
LFRKAKDSDKLSGQKLSAEGMEYEKYTFYRTAEDSFFVIRNSEGERGITKFSVKLFELVKSEFSDFTYASVSSINKERAISEPNSKDGIKYRLAPQYDDYLILTDYQGNQLHLTGCSVGYAGTGPHGTHEVLNKLGFKVPMRFIIAMKQFNLDHPNNDPEYSKMLRDIDEEFF